MYRATSPIFEAPPLRRLKLPLPKRKRISESSAGTPLDTPIAVSSSPSLLHDPSADELIAHTDSLSAQMALQSYYMPILGGMHDLLKDDNHSATPTTDSTRGPDEDVSVDGDYIDHLQQPGNTKKRKVPANMSGSRQPGGGSFSSESHAPGDKSVSTGKAEPDGSDTLASSAIGGTGVQISSLTLNQRKGRVSDATLAGLKHKEMLKTRKRQLAAVLGALSHGDTFALDQALSARYPFGLTGDPEPIRIRLSKRKGPQLARTAKTRWASRTDKAALVKFPSRKFSFVYPSTTSERLAATRQEVAILHSKFEAELSRQATKAAEAAKETVPAGQNLKRPAGGKQAVPGSKAANSRPVDQLTLEQQALGPKRGGKKKKRSALANASNPHHLRNYVPSRLPNSGQTTQANVNSQNYLNPPPLRFLSAQIPPRNRKDDVVVSSTLTNPADEWICPFCEYKLFYGEEPGYTKSVRNRKKILKRRRRAQERAAAAASGKPLSTAPERGDPVFDDGNREAEFEGPYAKDAVPGAAHKPPRWKTDPGIVAGGGFNANPHSLG